MIDQLNEYDHLIARNQSRARFGIARERFEVLVDLVKRGTRPAWPLWRKHILGDPTKD